LTRWTEVAMNTSLRRVLAFVVALTASPAHAEGYLYSPYAHQSALLTAGWEVAVPTMSLRSEFIDATSLTGIGVGMRYGLATQLSAGADVTWNRFHQDSAIGDRFRMDAVSLRGTIHYYFSGSRIQPYAGFGAGGLYREAILNDGPTQVGLGVCGGPELGLLLTTGKGVAIHLATRYEITTASFDVNGRSDWNVKFPSWFSVQLGFALY
jgi:hypothetical protein